MEIWERVYRNEMLQANEWRIEEGRVPRTQEEMDAIIEQIREKRKNPDYFKLKEISEEELNRRFGIPPKMP